jgi:SAM-dependent methyltransferase
MNDRLQILGQKLRLLAWWTGLYLPPDRRVLERTILPEYGRRGSCRRILFVGIRPYTRGYGRHFRGREYVTIDPDPRMRFFGSSRHVIDRIENLSAHFSPDYFDLIVLNGVIGWGVDSPPSVERALDECFNALDAGGEFVIGLNEERAETPDLSQSVALTRFEPIIFPPLGAQRSMTPTPFAEKSHTFLFFRKPLTPAAR